MEFVLEHTPENFAETFFMQANTLQLVFSFFNPHKLNHNHMASQTQHPQTTI